MIINPNITSGPLNIQLMQPTESQVILTITDLSGKAVLTKTQKTSQGLNSINLDLSNISTGIYYIRVTDGAENYIRSVLKK